MHFSVAQSNKIPDSSHPKTEHQPYIDYNKIMNGQLELMLVLAYGYSMQRGIQGGMINFHFWAMLLK